jgi:hypothetical protein
MEVQDDVAYVDLLNTLSEGSVRRSFNPYTDIDWDAPEFAVTDSDERWILPATDPLGRHSWYRGQSIQRQIEIGQWRQANVAKVGLQFESILIRGLMNYSFWVPNGSPEYRYLLHESVEGPGRELLVVLLPAGLRPGLRVGIAAVHVNLPGAGQCEGVRCRRARGHGVAHPGAGRGPCVAARLRHPRTGELCAAALPAHPAGDRDDGHFQVPEG